MVLRESAEAGEAMEGQQIGVVEIGCPALAIIGRSAAGRDQVITVELPVDVLETVMGGLGMVEQLGVHLPRPQIGRAHERQGVALIRGLGRQLLISRSDQRPPARGLRVAADGELLRASGEGG